ncbi:MAG: chromosome segregation protein SMC [Thermoplasmatales archaeon]|nr:MAG: chromosome segregation protein SMC [Thermoplasmatales archaeon]
MRLYSLEIKNFKSFCHKGMKIDFRPGLSMIAGPNGSGKSNIGDSLLFVLGTRSSKTVRADKLDDLIHNPANGDKKVSRAEVKAVFVEDRDDESFETVEISRTIEENGSEINSTYFINGKRSKHSEVDRFLENIGIQLDSYSFVLQGDINKFIYVSGNERRKLLESIAGIDAYNMRINSAKEKIDEIDKTILASETLRTEIEENIAVIEKEAEKLREYKKLNSDIVDLRATALSIQIRGIEIDLSGHQQSMEESEKKIADIKAILDDLDKEREVLAQKRMEIEKGIGEKIQKELESIRKGIESKKLERARSEISASNINISIDKERALIETNTGKIEEIDEEIDNLAKGFNELMKREEELKYRETSLRAQINQKIELQRNKTEEYRKATDELTVIEKQLKENSTITEKIRREESEESKKFKGLETKLGIKEENLTNEKYRLSETQWQLNQIKKDEGGNRSKNESLSKKYYELQSQIKELERERTETRSKMDNLGKEVERMRSEMGSRGFANKSISAIMEAKARGAISGIHRSIGELISYDEKYALAVEAAAGGRLNSIVVDNEDVAQDCIELLREKKLGRVTFIPLNKILPGRPRGKALTIIQQDRTTSLLSQQVKCQDVYANAIWYTFQDTVLVDSAEIAKKYMTGVRIVTLDGDIFEASGAISGGFMNRSRTTFNFSELDSKEKLLEDLRERFNSLDHDIRNLRQEYDDISKQLMDISKSGGEGKGKSDSLEAQLKESQKIRESLELEIQTLKIELKNSSASLEKLQELITKEEEKKASLEKRKNELYMIIGDNKEEGNDLSELQRELEKISNEQTSTMSIKSSNQTTMKKISERKSELMMENDNLIKNINAETTEKDRIEEEIAKFGNEIGRLEEEEEKLNENNRKIIQGLKEIERQLSDISQKSAGLESDMKNNENAVLTSKIKIQNFNEKLSALKEELRQNGGNVIIDYSSAQKANSEIAIRMAKLQEIGAVNQLAEEDLKRDMQRKENLVEKIDILKREVDSLIKLMAELEEVKTRVLLDLYGKVKIEMREIFKRLTRGGDVDMYLSDESNPLESELLIKAKPKGTTYTKLQSLSGGEKSLVALSFIVAVQRIKPSPIYFLDEIDMFLDGTNAEAMGELLRENSNTSQIIMISLKNAMSKFANSLFGVTMNKAAGCTEIFSKSFGGE